MPAPAACTIRPTRRTGKFAARLQMSVPAAKSAMEVMYNWRVVNRSNRNAVMGMTIPFTSIKAVVNQLAVTAEIFLNGPLFAEARC